MYLNRTKQQLNRAVVQTLEARQLLSAAPVVINSNIRDGADLRDDGGVLLSLELDAALKPFTAAAVEVTNVSDPSTIIYPFKVFDNGARYLQVGFELTPGTYTARVRSGNGFIEGLDGQDLDGEYNGAGKLSGDGIAGGDYVVTFTTQKWSTQHPAPYDVQAHAISSDAIEVKWGDDTAAEYGHTIERAVDDGPFEFYYSGYMFADAYDKMYTFTDNAVEVGKAYRYRVRYDYFENDVRKSTVVSDEAIAQPLPANLTFPVGTLPSEIWTHPDNLTAVGNNLFYTINKVEQRADWASENGLSLWRTDGSGSTPVEIFNGPARELIRFTDALFFSGYSAGLGWELYKSDGTPEGTHLVRSLAEGADSTNLRMLASSGSTLYFSILNTAGLNELWRTDGTPEGTFKASDQYIFLDNVRRNSYANRNLYAISAGGSRFYFRKANVDGQDSGQLWSTNGTPAGTAQITGISNPEWLADFNGTLFLAANTGNPLPDYNVPLYKSGLWKVDPATGTPGLIMTAGTDGWYGMVRNLQSIGGKLYFNADGDNHNGALWISDGTIQGTDQISNQARSNSLRTYKVEDVGGVAYMLGIAAGSPPDLTGGYIISSDGTRTGTNIIRGFRGMLDGSVPHFSESVAGSYVYTDGEYVWVTKNSRESGRRISKFGRSDYSGTHYGDISAVVGDTVFFTVQTNDYTRELRFASLIPPAQPTNLEQGDTSSAPGAVTVAAGTGASTQLSWTDNASNENGYVLDRYSGDQQLPVESWTLAENSTSYLAGSASPGDSYRLRAYNAGGYSSALLADGSTLSADIVDIAPDPRATGVDSVTIILNRKAYGFGLSDLRLSRNGGKNLLTNASLLRTIDYKTFTLSNLKAITTAAGSYTLRVIAAGGPVDGYGRTLTADVLESWTNNAVSSPPPPPAAVPMKFNFQPASAPAVSGYLIDAGGTFGARNGKNYGWSVNHADVVVDRNKNTNQLLDTNVGVKAGGKWELAVPNGTYTVKIGVGDALLATKNNVYVEGVMLFNYQAQAANTFSNKTLSVKVSDGRLTVGVGSAAAGTTRLDFIEVTPPAAPPTSPPPTSPPPATAGTKINFQPASAPTVAGYLVDAGATYAARNGKTYGWSTSHTTSVVDRNKNTNQLLDTNLAVKAGGKWELAVPNGTYTVKVGVGDAGATSTNNVWIEGVQVFNYQKLTTNVFSHKSVSVKVADGKMTLSIGSIGSGLTKLDFIEVS